MGFGSSIVWDLISHDRSSATNDRVASSFDKLDHRTGLLSKTMHVVSGAAVLMGGALTTAAGFAVVGGVKTAASLETTTVGFTTLLGSAKKANDYIGWMKKFAAATPFNLAGLTDSARLLIGVGVSAKESKVILQDFGDTAGAVGMDADHFSMAMLAVSQSISAGHIKLGDMNQLMNDGIPIWKLLSEAMGKPVPEIQKMISKGQLLSKDVMPKLLAAMHKDYGGAMAKQSQTLTGLWSTLMDTVNLGMADVLQPLVPIIEKRLPGAIATLGKWLATGAAGVKAFMGAWSSGKVTDTGGFAKVQKVALVLKTTLGQVKSAAHGILTVISNPAFQAFAAGITAAVIALKAYRIVVGVATAAQIAFDAAMDANPVGIVVLAVEALAVGLVVLYKRSATFRAIVKVAGAEASAAFHGVSAAVRATAHVIGSVMPGIKFAIKAAFNPSMLVSAGADIVRGLARGMLGAIPSVVAAAGRVAAAVPGKVKSLLGISSPSKVMKLLGGWTMQGFIDGIRGKNSEVKSALGDVKSLLSKEITKIEGIYDKHKQKLADLKASYKDLKSSVRDAFAGTSITDRGDSFGAVMANFQQSIVAGKASAAALAKLKKLGLRSDLLQQLAAGGSSSLGLEQSILSAGPGSIAALNSQQSTMLGIGNAAGTTVANQAYAKAIASETRETARLHKAVTELQKEMKRLTEAMKHPGNINAARFRAELYKVLRQAGALAGG